MKRIQSFGEFLDHGIDFSNAIIHGIDFRLVEINWASLDLCQSVFLGCKLNDADRMSLINGGALLFERPGEIPYDPYRTDLYKWEELLNIDKGSSVQNDLRIYQHFQYSRFHPPILESLMQRIYDHAIDDALRRLIGSNGDGSMARKCIGIMGGHGCKRTDPFYRKTALASKWLAENGYLVVSGGGPGIMEAANLGASLAGEKDELCMQIIGHISKSPHYEDENFLELSIQCLQDIPRRNTNLAIPTWFYGHEPSNVYATHIAKYFSNSIREDTLLAICLHGIIFAPGSAGTSQEIFMDAAQNHYGTYSYMSPMVFLGKKRYEHDTMIFPLLKQLSYGMEYGKLLFLTDEPDEIVQFILNHPPKKII